MEDITSMPKPLEIFAHFMAFELLSRETLSRSATRDVLRRKTGFLKEYPNLQGAGFLIEPKTLLKHYMNITIIDIKEQSSFGDLPAEVRAFLIKAVNQVFTIVQMVTERWHKDFPHESIKVTFYKNKFILAVNSNSLSGVGFRALIVSPD